MDIHPLIFLFQTKADLLDVTDSPEDLDDAISLLAGWMDKVKAKLSEDDLAILSDIGAVLYREGLKRKLQRSRHRLDPPPQ